MANLSNITCAAFGAMPEAEQRAFVIGVANGRGMTVCPHGGAGLRVGW